MRSIQYTVRGIPAELDAELRKEARATGRTLNAVVVETLGQAKRPAERIHDDLDWFVGSAPGGSGDEEAAAQAWLDALPAELS
jgi:hypothetical protein